MKFIEFDKQRVTIELDPTDRFVLAQACEASVRCDGAQNPSLAEAPTVAFTAAGIGRWRPSARTGCRTTTASL